MPIRPVEGIAPYGDVDVDVDYGFPSGSLSPGVGFYCAVSAVEDLGQYSFLVEDLSVPGARRYALTPDIDVGVSLAGGVWGSMRRGFPSAVNYRQSRRGIPISNTTFLWMLGTVGGPQYLALIQVDPVTLAVSLLEYQEMLGAGGLDPTSSTTLSSCQARYNTTQGLRVYIQVSAATAIKQYSAFPTDAGFGTFTRLADVAPPSPSNSWDTFPVSDYPSFLFDDVSAPYPGLIDFNLTQAGYPLLPTNGVFLAQYWYSPDSVLVTETLYHGVDLADYSYDMAATRQAVTFNLPAGIAPLLGRTACLAPERYGLTWGPVVQSDDTGAYWALQYPTYASGTFTLEGVSLDDLVPGEAIYTVSGPWVYEDGYVVIVVSEIAGAYTARAFADVFGTPVQIEEAALVGVPGDPAFWASLSPYGHNVVVRSPEGYMVQGYSNADGSFDQYYWSEYYSISTEIDGDLTLSRVRFT